jgi:hypothetical protein
LQGPRKKFELRDNRIGKNSRVLDSLQRNLRPEFAKRARTKPNPIDVYREKVIAARAELVVVATAH